MLLTMFTFRFSHRNISLNLPLLQSKISSCMSECIDYDSAKIHSASNNSLLDDLPNFELDQSFFCNLKNKDDIHKNIIRRKGVGDIDKVLQLYSEYTESKSDHVKNLLLKEILKIPNWTHPDVLKYGEKPHVLEVIGEKKQYTFKPNIFENLTKSLNILRNDVSNFTGHRSYFFTSKLSELEYALVKYSVGKLIDKGFQVMSVPDVLPRSTIEGCGMESRGVRSQVYSLHPDYYGQDKCLSGTAEMALAAYLTNKELPVDELPLRLAAVSRCYRAETSRVSEERGLYRVHQFTKVEMFGVSEPERSSELLEEFRQFQVEHFSSLGLHLQVLDMPAHELGAQAYRKYDVEAWLPGKKMWGEVSSCSDCTDYQSRRLAIRAGGRHVHTVNGTACAVPRLMIAIFETHQQADGSVQVPSPLQPFMKGDSVINTHNARHVPQLKPIKRIKS